MLFGDFLRFLGFQGRNPRPKHVRGAHGWSKTTGPYGEIIWCDTLTCCHCQMTWEYVEGSGRERGWCPQCHDGKTWVTGVTCGAPLCMVHLPWERKLENIEAGRPLMWVPPEKVLITAEPPKSEPIKLIVPGE